MVPFLLRRAVLALLLVSAAADAGVLDKLFAPKADPWPRWSAHDEGNRQRIDHGAWDRFLAAHVVPGSDGIARIAYGRVSAADRAALSGYLDSLSAVSVSRYSRAEQFAFWVNLYNALTVRTVLEHYPVESIRDIDLSSGLLADGPWGAKLIEVEGEAVSLDDIEHRILRPIWKDPRIHYAVNCASLGCPNLRRSAFTAANTESLLDRGAREYVNHPRGARVAGDSLVLSSIYSWFESDFSPDGGVLPHLRRYADPDLAARLKGRDRAQEHRYDWTLNDVAGVGR